MRAVLFARHCTLYPYQTHVPADGVPAKAGFPAQAGVPVAGFSVQAVQPTVSERELLSIYEKSRGVLSNFIYYKGDYSTIALSLLPLLRTISIGYLLPYHYYFYCGSLFKIRGSPFSV